MHFRIERPRGGSGAQGRDRFRMATLPRERDSEVERRVGIVGAHMEDGSKCALRLGELLVLQRLPPMCKRDVRRCRTDTRAAVRGARSNAIAQARRGNLDLASR